MKEKKTVEESFKNFDQMAKEMSKGLARVSEEMARHNKSMIEEILKKMPNLSEEMARYHKNMFAEVSKKMASLVDPIQKSMARIVRLEDIGKKLNKEMAEIRKGIKIMNERLPKRRG